MPNALLTPEYLEEHADAGARRARRSRDKRIADRYAAGDDGDYLEAITWGTFVRALAWNTDEALFAGENPDYIAVEHVDNLATTAGVTKVANLVAGLGGPPTAYNNGNTRIGLGDGNGGAVTPLITDSDMAAPQFAANRQWAALDATFPSNASGILSYRATFLAGQALFHIREWAIDSGTTAGTGAAVGTLLNHKGLDMGTKGSIAWQFLVTLTFS